MISFGIKAKEESGSGRAGGAVRVLSASRRGEGPPRRRRVSGLRGWTDTLGLRYGPDSYGRQQLRIFRNGGNPDGATPRGRRRPEGCKVLFSARNKAGRECPAGDGSGGISTG